MNTVYQALGMSKQSFHQRMERYMARQEELHQMLPLISQLRIDHPAMSVRIMFQLLQPVHIGRDAFIAFCFSYGYKVECNRSFHKTTNSNGVIRFDNLIIRFECTDVDQVWVTDITYYRIEESFYYITFIMDLFSRRIIGYSASRTLRTEDTTIPSLKMAVKQRNSFEGVILHGDGGGQYYCREFLKLTIEYKIRNSMCETVYENAHAERVNGTIKNDYLKYYGPQDFEELKIKLRKAVDMYNKQRPHKSLNFMSPVQFEELLTKNPIINKRKKVAKKENYINKMYTCTP